MLHSGGGDLTEGWEDGRRRSAVLPVAVGHGILSLLLLEELCDGQQLFQHVLQRGNKELDKSPETGRHKIVLCVGTAVISPVSDLLCSPLIAQRPELV